jgi:hypothetical protein
MRSKNCFGISFTFGNGESFALTICGEHVIKTFDHAFLFFITITFMNIFFTECFARHGGEKKRKVCIANACKLSFYQFHGHWLLNNNHELKTKRRIINCTFHG